MRARAPPARPAALCADPPLPTRHLAGGDADRAEEEEDDDDDDYDVPSYLRGGTQGYDDDDLDGGGTGSSALLVDMGLVSP